MFRCEFRKGTIFLHLPIKITSFSVVFFVTNSSKCVVLYMKRNIFFLAYGVTEMKFY